LITANMRRTGHSSYSITRDRGAPEVADSRGPPAMGRWAGGASPPLLLSTFKCSLKTDLFDIAYRKREHLASLCHYAVPLILID